MHPEKTTPFVKKFHVNSYYFFSTHVVFSAAKKQVLLSLDPDCETSAVLSTVPGLATSLLYLTSPKLSLEVFP